MRQIARSLLLVVIFAIPSIQVPIEDPHSPLSMGSINRVLGLVLVGAWILSVLVRQSLRAPSAFHVAAFLFLVWNAVSLTWSADVAIGFTKVTRYIQGVMLCLVLWDLLRTPQDITAASQAYILGGIVSAIGVVYDYATKAVSRYSAEGRGSAYGFDPNDLACQLAMMIPLALYLLKMRGQESSAAKLVNAIAAVLAGMAIFLTGSRTAMIAGLTVFALGFQSLRKLRWHSKVFLATAVLGAVLIVTQLGSDVPLTRFESISTSADSDGFSGRFALWKAGWETFKMHPLVGIGTGQFKVSIPIANKFGIAHNVYLGVLTELGIVGLSLFACILILVAVSAVRQMKSGTPVWALCFLVWSIAASALTWEQDPWTWLLFGMVISSGHAHRVESQGGDRILPLESLRVRTSPVGPPAQRTWNEWPLRNH
jgi:O-antigen ligase